MAKSLLNAMAVFFLLCCNPYLTLMLQQRAGLLLLLPGVGRAGRREPAQPRSAGHTALHTCLPSLVLPLSSYFWALC